MADKIKILIVDPSKGAQARIIEMLASLNLAYLRAFSGEEALQLLEGHEVAFAVVNSDLTTLTAVETIVLMHQQKKTHFLPVLLLAPDQEVLESLEGDVAAGTVDYCVVPVMPALLLGKAKALLELYWAKKERAERQAYHDTLELYLEKVQDFNQDLLNTVQTLMGSIPFGMSIVDQSGEILFVNPQLGKRLDVNVLGKKCWEVFRDDAQKCVTCPLDFPFEVGRTVEFENDGYFGGRSVYVTHSDMMYKGKKASLEIFQDITDRKKAQEELRALKDTLADEVARKTAALLESQEKLLKAERLAAMGQTAGTIAHEVKNQLGTIKNIAFLLNMKLGDSDEKIARYLAILNEQIEKTGRIMQNILSFARVKELQCSSVSVPELLNSVVEKFMLTKPDGIMIEVAISDNLPVIQADEEKLIQIFNNLILNAFDAVEKKGTVTVAACVGSERLTISVSDTGVGIPPEVRNNIFEPLFTTKVTGTGFGLATVKTLVEHHGGSVSVESEEGKGSRFVVQLPL